MPLFDDLMGLLQHPAAPGVAMALLTGRQGQAREDGRLHARLDLIDRQIAALGAMQPASPAPPAAGAPRDQSVGADGRVAPPRAAPGAGAASAFALPPAQLGDVAAAAARVAEQLEEALRFAREDGMDHAEVTKRLGEAAAVLPDLERWELRSDRLVQLPPDQRAAAERLLVRLRDVRQQVSDLDGHLTGPPTVDRLHQVSAGAQDLALRLRVLSLAGPAASPPSSAAADRPDSMVLRPAHGGPPVTMEGAVYSRYAPDMDLDRGCLPCGVAHFGATKSALAAMAAAARERGVADPVVQGRLTQAAQELDVMRRWDWTPERIANTPLEDQAVLRVFAPRAWQLLDDVRAGVRTPEEAAALAARADALREDFRAALHQRYTGGGGGRGDGRAA